jgi:TetR/AcrR family transcriptional regulator, regulator of cefoperazone and chloramphenicol sensitivity
MTRATGGRGEETRQALLEAATDIFGRKGFDASTRELATAAGVNLAAIPYYFGTKENLYVACAEHIATRMTAHIGPRLQQVGEMVEQLSPGDRERARQVIILVLSGLAEAMVKEEAATWARFIIREQMEPTEAFERIYEGVMARLLAILRAVIGRALKADPSSEEIRLRAIGAASQVLVFRAARAAVMRQLGWKEIGKREMAAIRTVIERAAAAAVS